MPCGVRVQIQGLEAILRKVNSGMTGHNIGGRCLLRMTREEMSMVVLERTVSERKGYHAEIHLK